MKILGKILQSLQYLACPLTSIQLHVTLYNSTNDNPSFVPTSWLISVWENSYTVLQFTSQVSTRLPRYNSSSQQGLPIYVHRKTAGKLSPFFILHLFFYLDLPFHHYRKSSLLPKPNLATCVLVYSGSHPFLFITSPF